MIREIVKFREGPFDLLPDLHKYNAEIILYFVLLVLSFILHEK